MNIICKECGKEFDFSSKEQNFYTSMNYEMPKRCPECRKARKAAKKEAEAQKKWEEAERKLSILLKSLPYQKISLGELKFENPEHSLVIIGNGFDIMHGVKSSYWDFQKTIGKNSSLRYEMETYLDVPGDLWSNLEDSLGRLNYSMFLNPTVLDMWLEKYFSEDDGKVILRSIKSTLDAFNESDNTSDARFETSDYQLKAILESLSLTVPETHPGLGELNLLFMAAELLLLKHDDNGCLKLALIEELEAHLHPQAQLRLISYLQNEYNESGAQIIVSTHSTMLASKINLKNIVLLKNGVGYDLSYGKTGLEKGDYLFLQRFLDTSKANLFFARGIIMVEGDAENILIPTLAEIIGLPLEKHGVSVVNVGSTAFLRYSRILTRADHSSVSIPVAIITDCDVRPEYKEDGSFDKKLMETTTKVGDKESYYSVDTIKGFIAPRWTLEYCLALSALASDFHKAIHYAKKIKNSDKYSLTVDKIQSENRMVETEQSEWKQFSNEEKAYKIFQLMLDESNKSGLKAIVAQCLASMLKWKYVEKTDDLTEENMFDLDLYQYRILEDERIKLKEIIENDPYINYLAKAIRYAVGLEV